MANTFTGIEQEGWFSRIGGAIKGVFVGVVLTFLSCAVLFWNEGRAVKTARSLDEGRTLAVEVSPDGINEANEGKLIVVGGEARGTETVRDAQFGITGEGIALQRKVSYYQWVEDKTSRTQKKLGGGTETVTTYNYTMRWVSSPVDSSRFKDPSGHANPTSVQYRGERFRAKEVKLGAFTLSDKLADGIIRAEPLAVSEVSYQAIPGQLKDQVKWVGGSFYLGPNPNAPALGDEKIEFGLVKPQMVTVVGRQTGHTVAGYETTRGKTLEFVREGKLSKDQFFAAEKSANAMMSWIFRAGGFLVCFIALLMILSPLSVLADVIPFIGDLVGMGTGVVAFCGALMLSAFSIALGWFAYRPLLSLALVAVGFGVVWYLHQNRRRVASLKQVSAGRKRDLGLLR